MFLNDGGGVATEVQQGKRGLILVLQLTGPWGNLGERKEKPQGSIVYLCMTGWVGKEFGMMSKARVYEKVREIPRSQRYINRPSLEEIFRNTKKNKGRRNTGIAEAVGRWGYSQRGVADHLGLHYSTVSRLVKEGNFKISRLKT
jgi:hypothetical protein